ncbi:ABC transporter permease [Corynebacterium sp.]|uniref:ABC transporter permease n=1 Tax=Corynebacterium sp. TaxID=1720 RepID=UPI002A90E01E|nr:ABC transporter permease [Corynebacterium sp.]MDY5785613.1 ABC transporter permease [Corynebacterium sp.]
MLNTFTSEWTKLRTTPAFWWTSALVLGLPLVFAAAFGAMDTPESFSYIPLSVVMMVASCTTLIVTLQAIMTVTTEYRHGTHATTFRINPNRWQVAVAKLVLASLIGAVLTFVALVLAFTIGDALAFNPAHWTTNPATTRALWALPLAAVFVVMFSQGLGWIVRNTAGAVTLAFALQFVIEALVSFLPRIGQDLAEYMPFSNLYAFMLNTPRGGLDPWEALGVYAVWAVVVWIIGLVLLHTRDA